MWLRINDVIVGVITGLLSAVIAASLEAGFTYARLFTFGHAGGGLGSKLPFIAVIGAIVGGIVGLGLSGILKPRRIAASVQAVSREK